MTKLGKLFVFEGPDGVGKSTLSEQVAERLATQGESCVYLTFPGREEETLGRHIYALHHEPERFGVTSIHPTSQQVLHIAAHIDAIENRILPTLREGRHVVLDRFWWSTWVYGKVNGVPIRALNAMLQVELEHWGLVLPSIVFLIDRESPLREEEPPAIWHQRRAAYHELAAKQRERHLVQVVGNNGLLEAALAEILHVINHTFKEPSSSSGPSHAVDTCSQEKSQLHFELDLQPRAASFETTSLPIQHSHLAPAEPTELFDTFWHFAAERQAIFFRRLEGTRPPWTDDPVLTKYKFTNAYRASDRVSQYLIKDVIYKGEQSPEETFFRILIYKIFNRIETWELLEQEVGAIRYEDYSFEQYDTVLTRALTAGKKIFSAAYIMPPGTKSFGYPLKHRNFLKLLELMMDDDVPQRIVGMRLMKDVFELLRSYPNLGDFLAYQYAIDINYSTLTNFSEATFVVPGPGALEGIRKCFKSLGGLNEVDIIALMMERQEEEFKRLGITFQSLWGRRLQLIDCQNLFCEVDKYSRIAYPHVKGKTGRVRIKQGYQPTSKPIKYWYPPKWGLNDLIEEERKGNDAPI